MNVNVLSQHHSLPLLKIFGITHPFFNLNTITCYSTWIGLSLLICAITIVRISLHNKSSVIRWMAVNATSSFMDIFTQSMGHFEYKHASFLYALFLFIFTCNIIGIIPYVEEPTVDINTTFALGIISFLYTNGYGIHTYGLREYLKEFFQPFFVMFPLHIIGKLSSILSISFRLFGNIMGGFVISNMYFTTVGGSWAGMLINFVSGLNFLITGFFGVFESFIQAFVFTLLSLTYLSLALQHEQTEGDTHV